MKSGEIPIGLYRTINEGTNETFDGSTVSIFILL